MTWNTDITIYKFLIAILKGYVANAKKEVIVENEEEINKIIEELYLQLTSTVNCEDVLTEEMNNRRNKTFEKLSKILPSLWY